MIFRENFEYITQRNAENAGRTYTLGVNKFADWTKEERRALSKGVIETKVLRQSIQQDKTFDYGVLPQSVDWR